MIDKRKLKFVSGAMSIIQMGEEQIGHPSTAINELVKNAYDADADKCWVYTQYDRNSERNFLIIKDNGLGMSEDILFNNWLITSKSSKRDEDKELRKSKIYERRYLGSKGIGRLAAMALGRYLTVISKRSEDKYFNWLRIDREKFRGEELLDEISFSGGKIDNFIELFTNKELLEEINIKSNGNLIHLMAEAPFSDFREGTMIILQDVDKSVNTIIEEEINQKDLESMVFYKSLVDLVTPMKLNDKVQKELVELNIIEKELKISNGIDTFELYYAANFIENSKKNKIEFIEVVPSNIINFFDYRIFGKITSDYNVSGRYICKRLIDYNKDEEFYIKPEYLLSDEDLNIRNKITFDDIPTKYKDVSLGEFYFDFRVYDLEDDLKDKMAERLKFSNKREAMQAMNKLLGVKVSKNGFGVKPYGEEDKDWLGLGAQRVKKHIVTVGPNQILGYVYLYSPQNDALNEKTNREGFYEGKEFVVFRKIITGILEEAGRRRAKYREIHKLGVGRGKAQDKFERPNSEKFIQYLATRPNLDPEIMRLSEEFITETNTTLDNMQETLTLSQRLATLGIGLELVYHEIAQPVSAIGGSLGASKINIAKISDDILKNKLQKSFDNIQQSLTVLDELKESLQPAIGKSRPKNFKPFETIKKVLFLYKDKIEELKITINISKNLEELTLKNTEYNFWVSFLNIINNAIYWLQFSEYNKIINFEYKEETIIISNTSHKISEEELEIVFQYGITGKQERNATGLGLAFTRNMLESIDWEIWAENLSFGPAFYIKPKNNNNNL